MFASMIAAFHAGFVYRLVNLVRPLIQSIVSVLITTFTAVTKLKTWTKNSIGSNSNRMGRSRYQWTYLIDLISWNVVHRSRKGGLLSRRSWAVHHSLFQLRHRWRRPRRTICKVFICFGSWWMHNQIFVQFHGTFSISYHRFVTAMMSFFGTTAWIFVIPLVHVNISPGTSPS